MSANYALAKERALSLLNDCNITKPNVDVFEVASKQGVDVRFYSPTEALKEVSGFFDPKEKVIYVNADDSPKRQVFTVAHELGHYVMEHQPNEYGVLPRFANPAVKDPKEQEANCFAANLLVPEQMLKAAMSEYHLKDTDSAVLAGIFGVSEETMIYRLKQIS